MTLYKPGDVMYWKGSQAVVSGNYFVIAGPLGSRYDGHAVVNGLVINGTYRRRDVAVIRNNWVYYVITDKPASED